jgi:hypothetical protein
MKVESKHYAVPVRTDLQMAPKIMKAKARNITAKRFADAELGR